MELTYRYLAPSRLEAGGLTLATSGGFTPSGQVANPYFFSGFMRRPDVVGAGLLAVARLARTRFYTPPTIGRGGEPTGALDPVVTSTDEGLRFESFSACCGVYARLDVDRAALDATHLGVGVTNVDVNQPLRAALASLRVGEPLHLSVGDAGLKATTLDCQVREEKVPLTQRWLKSFAQTQMLSSNMALVHRLDATQARAFIRALPRSSSTGCVMWAAKALRGLRLGTTPTSASVCVAGPERLRVFDPLMHQVTCLEAYGPSVDENSEAAACLWVAHLPGARLNVGLSPAKTRGFAGEGATLALLGSAHVKNDAAWLNTLLSFQGRIDVPEIASQVGLSKQRVVEALALLADSGQVGFDVTNSSYFHRPLPVKDTLEAMHPRLAGARALLDKGAIRPQNNLCYQVVSDANHYQVQAPQNHLNIGAYQCTCPWWLKHRGGRGPCKHVLAVYLKLKENK